MIRFIFIRAPIWAIILITHIYTNTYDASFARAAQPTSLPIKEVAPNTKIEFDQVAKILKKNCIACHTGPKAEAKLVLDTPESILKGGESGPGMVKSKSGESRIFLAASHQSDTIMPPTDNKVNAQDLSPDELGILKAWIDSGAVGTPQQSSVAVKWKAVPTHINAIYATAVSPDGSLAAAGSSNKLVLIDLAKGKEIARLIDPHLHQSKTAHIDLIQSLAFDPSGQLLASGAFREIKLWRQEKTADGESLWKLERRIGSANESDSLTSRVLSLHFSPDGKSLISGGGEPTRSGEIKIWNPADGTQVRTIKEPHTDTVFCVRYSPSGEYFASSAADRMVKLFKSNDGSLVHTFEGHTHHVLSLAWKHDNSALVSGSADSTIKVWDVKSGEQKRTIQGFNKEITSLTLLGETSHLVAGSGNNMLKLINIDGGNVERTFTGFRDFIFSVSASSTGKQVVAGGEDGMLKIYDTTKNEPLKTIHLTH